MSEEQLLVLFKESLTDKEKAFYSEPMNHLLHARFESFKAGYEAGLRI